MEQLSFLSCRWPKAKSPRRADTLALLEKILPWGDLEQMVRPHYFADQRSRGRPGFRLQMMIRLLVIQKFWGFTDAGLEGAILDSLALARFIGTDPWHPKPPSASAHRAFRQEMDHAGLSEYINRQIEDAVCLSGLQYRVGSPVEPVFRRVANQQKGPGSDH